MIVPVLRDHPDGFQHPFTGLFASRVFNRHRTDGLKRLWEIHFSRRFQPGRVHTQVKTVILFVQFLHRALFILIQCGFLAMYSAALYYVDRLGTVMVPIVTITAMSGIAVRLFLLSSIALQHPDAGKKFRRLFPVLLLMDAMWAASPLLAIEKLGTGVALAGAAALAYLPFSQRTLIERLYGK